jgi:membrane fusion protein (multidrug efflux system)
MSTTVEPPESKPVVPVIRANGEKEIKAKDAAQPPKARSLRMRWLILAIVLIGALAWLGHFLIHAFHYQDTDDAYVAGHVHQVAPQIEGLVSEVLINDNQAVTAGQVLIKLDPLEYEIGLQRAQAAVEQALAQSAQATAAKSQADAQLAEAEAKATQAEAQERQSAAELELAQENYARNQQLFRGTNDVITKADFDATQSALDAKKAANDAAKANVIAARAGIASAHAAQEAAEAQQAAARAMANTGAAGVREAQRKLSDTVLKAPADGRVGNKNVETGNRVQAGQTLLAFVEPDMWVVANFKETQLARMKPGQPVELFFDAVPGHTFHGTVDSLAPASGAQFALLPADNATGNFTKIVQRVPVKIVLDAEAVRTLGERLRPGLSTVVDVKVR